MTGRTISHYRILEKLGEGGMGVVYKAEDLKLRRTVALKFLPPHAVENRERFLREAQAAASLNHPNICTIHEIDEEHGFIAMEFIEGPGVKEKIEARPLPLAEALNIALQVCTGLQTAHEKGIVHRDIKPANIMVTAQGQVKITDFGLAQVGDRTRITKAGVSMGTPAYMAPEQAQGITADRRTDIWALGVVLYEMLTRKLPFDAEREAALLHAIIHEEPEPVTALRSGIPRDMDRIVGKALAKDPAQRYQHTDDFRVDLEGLAARSSLRQVARVSTGPARFPWRWVLGAGVMGAMLAAGALLWVLGPRPKSSPDLRVHVLPLTSYRGQARNPSFSPDGTQVAFDWDGGQEGPHDIYVKVVGADEARRLTDSPENDIAPVWSPDGRWIAFLHSKNSELRLISPIGGAQRTLTAAVAWPVWMPKSDALVVTRLRAPEEPNRVEIVPLDGGEIRPLTEPPTGTHGERMAAVSPDGRRLAFQRCRTGTQGCRLYVQALPNGDPKLVKEQRVRAIAWTPDSRELILAGVGPWLVRLLADSSPGVEPTPIIGAGGTNPAVSRPGPDGKVRVAFERGLSRSSIWRSEIAPKPRADGGYPPESRQILASNGSDNSPFVSPDGKQILFASDRSDRSGEYRLWLADVDGGNPVMLVPLWVDNHRWSADGRKVVGDCFLTGVRGRVPCWIDVATRRATHVPIPSELHPVLPMLSTSGEAIYFNGEKGGEMGLWKASLDGREPLRLVEGFAWPMFESPDGRHIYFGRQNPERAVQALWRMTANGGAAEKVLDALTVGTWSVTPKGIYFIDDHQLKFLPFAQRAAGSIAKLTPSQIGAEMTLGPDAKMLLTTVREDLGTSLFYIDDFK